MTSGITLFDITDHRLRYNSNVLLTNGVFLILLCIYFGSFISRFVPQYIYISLIFLTAFRRQNFYKADVSNQCQIQSRNPVFFF